MTHPLYTVSHTTLAPLESTVCDMWRMVWEYRVEVIIMTTALTEDGKEVITGTTCGELCVYVLAPIVYAVWSLAIVRMFAVLIVPICTQ